MAEQYQASGIRYTVCGPGDAAEMVNLLAETFSRHDPPAYAMDISPAEFAAFVQLFSETAGTNGLTIIGREVATGTMAGALLTDDGAAPMPAGFDEVSTKFDPIFDILGQLDEEYRRDRRIESGEYLHLFLVGVDERFARRGIAQHLVAACLENGARRGYRVAFTEATNRVSQHIFGKLGFVERVSRSYGDYRQDGKAVFASIAEHGGPMSMDRKIAPRT